MIREYSPLPYIDEVGNLHPGLIRDIPRFCQECVNRTCAIAGYRERDAGVLKTCKYGARYLYAEDAFGSSLIWNGFLVKGEKYPNNYKKILRKGIELDQSALNALVGRFGPNGTIADKLSDLKKEGQSQTLHDLKHFINVISRTVENSEVKSAENTVNPSQSQIKLLQQVTLEVYQILGAIKNQIELADFIIAPEGFVNSENVEIDVFRLFHKNVNIYEVLAVQQGKNIRIHAVGGTINVTILAPEPFTLLPAILLDNAIKYSAKESTIDVMVEIIDGKISVSVVSFGAIVPEDERESIWKRDHRYSHPNLVRRPGSGYGLFLASQICDISNFDITYHCTINTYYRDVPFGSNKFTIKQI